MQPYCTTVCTTVQQRAILQQLTILVPFPSPCGIGKLGVDPLLLCIMIIKGDHNRQLRKNPVTSTLIIFLQENNRSYLSPTYFTFKPSAPSALSLPKEWVTGKVYGVQAR